MLAGRRIVLGISGGVAAYKAAYLARRLVERGAEVRAVMTEAGRQFIGPQTIAAITGHPPVVNLFGGQAVSPHTELAAWADIVVIAPATAATVARLALGLSDDALSTTVLAASVPVVVAPAMHEEMWEHPATRRNVARLVEDGTLVVGPVEGALAGGDEGVGRLIEPEAVVAAVEQALSPVDLAGWNVLVSAGGTREAIDPVRFIGNRSSGKMGNAIAVAAAQRGANVFLVTTAASPMADIETVRVETAAQMAEAVWGLAAKVDVAVLAAAVADFRPRAPSSEKLRRLEGPPGYDLEPTPDILAGVAEMPDPPFLVGFAAETGGLDVALEKAQSKGVDLLVANDVLRDGSGFGSETNEVTVISPDGAAEPWPVLPKIEVAHRLWDHIVVMRRG